MAAHPPIVQGSDRLSASFASSNDLVAAKTSDRKCNRSPDEMSRSISACMSIGGMRVMDKAPQFLDPAAAKVKRIPQRVEGWMEGSE
jgi:hypothetical protein